MSWEWAFFQYILSSILVSSAGVDFSVFLQSSHHFKRNCWDSHWGRALTGFSCKGYLLRVANFVCAHVRMCAVSVPLCFRLWPPLHYFLVSWLVVRVIFSRCIQVIFSVIMDIFHDIFILLFALSSFYDLYALVFNLWPYGFCFTGFFLLQGFERLTSCFRSVILKKCLKWSLILNFSNY